MNELSVELMWNREQRLVNPATGDDYVLSDARRYLREAHTALRAARERIAELEQQRDERRVCESCEWSPNGAPCITHMPPWAADLYEAEQRAEVLEKRVRELET